MSVCLLAGEKMISLFAEWPIKMISVHCKRIIVRCKSVLFEWKKRILTNRKTTTTAHTQLKSYDVWMRLCWWRRDANWKIKSERISIVWQSPKWLAYLHTIHRQLIEMNAKDTKFWDNYKTAIDFIFRRSLEAIASMHFPASDKNYN